MREKRPAFAREKEKAWLMKLWFVASAIHHAQSRTSGFLESTDAPKMQGAQWRFGV